MPALEDQHRRVGLEGFRQLAFLVEHRLVLGGEDHRAERHQDFSHLQVLAVRLEDLPLAFSHLQVFRDRLVKGEGFHHQVLEGDKRRDYLEVGDCKSLVQSAPDFVQLHSRYQRSFSIQMSAEL